MNYIYSIPFTPGDVEERKEAAKDMIDTMVDLFRPVADVVFENNSLHQYTIENKLEILLDNGYSITDEYVYIEISAPGQVTTNRRTYSEEMQDGKLRYKMEYFVRAGGIEINTLNSSNVSRIIARKILNQPYLAWFSLRTSSSGELELRTYLLITDIFAALRLRTDSVKHPNKCLMVPYINKEGETIPGVFYVAPTKIYYANDDLNKLNNFVANGVEYELVTLGDYINICMEV